MVSLVVIVPVALALFAILMEKLEAKVFGNQQIPSHKPLTSSKL